MVNIFDFPLRLRDAARCTSLVYRRSIFCGFSRITCTCDNFLPKDDKLSADADSKFLYTDISCVKKSGNKHVDTITYVCVCVKGFINAYYMLIKIAECNYGHKIKNARNTC